MKKNAHIGPVKKLDAIYKRLPLLNERLYLHGVEHIPRTTPLAPNSSTVLAGPCEPECPACLIEKEALARLQEDGAKQRKIREELEAALMNAHEKSKSNKQNKITPAKYASAKLKARNKTERAKLLNVSREGLRQYELKKI